MPSRNDRSSERVGAGGESPQEPLVDRQLELDALRPHIARVAETGKGHAVLILGESGLLPATVDERGLTGERHLW